MGDLRRLEEGVLGVFGVPQIAFEIGDRGRRHRFRVDIARVQVLRGAEIGVERALAVGRNQDVAAAGGRAIDRRRGGEGDARGTNVVRKDLPERVLLDLAHEGRARPEARRADNGVGGRAAGHLDGRSHLFVERLGLRFVDQRHAAFVHPMIDEEIVLGASDHINDRVADTEHVEAEACHGGSCMFVRGRTELAAL